MEGLDWLHIYKNKQSKTNCAGHIEHVQDSILFPHFLRNDQGRAGLKTSRTCQGFFNHMVRSDMGLCFWCSLVWWHRHEAVFRRLLYTFSHTHDVSAFHWLNIFFWVKLLTTRENDLEIFKLNKCYKQVFKIHAFFSGIPSNRYRQSLEIISFGALSDTNFPY